MSTVIPKQLRQRADYTHKHNLKSGRHGWLRLTPAYSLKIVEELIERFDRPIRVLDPFCGTATTALSSAYHGHEAVTTDINPFLVWLGQAKTAHYTHEQISATNRACSSVVKLVGTNGVMPVDAPPLHNIERWWNVGELNTLRVLRAAIEASTETNSAERTLLLVAFCRTLIALSNAAFNHQSISFKNNNQETMQLDGNIGCVFADNVAFVLSGAADNPNGSVSVMLLDARNLPAIGKGPFDCVITSPPYANRMSYIRELRPYMYWLEFLTNGRDAGELDWSAIGGTWGIATSRLMDWKRETGHFTNPQLNTALKGIEHRDNKSGHILANYVAKYFDDMWSHFQRLPLVLSPGAEVHYIVGNSSFYGVLLPVEQIYAAMLRQSGFADIQCRPIRKRNSKKELIEFDVMARLRPVK
jgi:hypothetical protein